MAELARPHGPEGRSFVRRTVLCDEKSYTDHGHRSVGSFHHWPYQQNRGRGWQRSLLERDDQSRHPHQHDLRQDELIPTSTVSRGMATCCPPRRFDSFGRTSHAALRLPDRWPGQRQADRCRLRHRHDEVTHRTGRVPECHGREPARQRPAPPGERER